MHTGKLWASVLPERPLTLPDGSIKGSAASSPGSKTTLRSAAAATWQPRFLSSLFPFSRIQQLGLSLSKGKTFFLSMGDGAGTRDV